MIIESLRLGELDIPEDKIIRMERPILGFEELKTFCLIEMDDLAPFMWFQSTDNPAVAFLVCNPIVFFPEYRIEINSMEVAELKINDVNEIETYVIVTPINEGADLSANLQGPLLINTENNRGKQLVLVNSHYKVRHSIMDAVESKTETTQTSTKKEELVQT